MSHGRPDVYGAATSRAEAQVLRLSALYAALDCSPVVELCHLDAALAVWDYCRSSARLFFDTTPIDPTVSRITQALDVNPQGLSQTQIRAIFHHHISKERIELQQLPNYIRVVIALLGTGPPQHGTRQMVKVPDLGALDHCRAGYRAVRSSI